MYLNENTQTRIASPKTQNNTLKQKEYKTIIWCVT